MEYQVNFGFHAFSIPSAVVDNFIKVAKENHLKVLLYLLRTPDRQFSVSQIASGLRLTEESVQDAFDFWMQFNILEEKSEGQQLELFPSEPAPKPVPVPKVSIQDMPFSAPVPEPAPVPELPELSPAPEQKEKMPNVLDRSHLGLIDFFSNEDIQEMQNSSPEIRKLIRTVQTQYYKGSFYVMQTKSLIWMYSYLGMPAEVILILLKYCYDIEKFNQQYINKIAYSWYEDDIMTPESAGRKVRELMEFYTYQNYICRVFEMDARPTKNQKEFIELWQPMGFSEEMLKYARDLSVEATGKVNFKYIHSILTEWHENQIAELKDAEKNHDEYIKKLLAKNKKGSKKKKTTEEMTEKERQKMNEYMSVVNQFHFEEGEAST
ncbi:MAG: DnaD domain protein [Oscillospiraceae bacterium]|nr:DnaD domain protein [Oscillospiraceae bacterium]